MGANIRILVVDNDVQFLLLLRQILKIENYQVTTAESGEKAIEIFKNINPDLIILDTILPGIDGLAVCEHIREFSQIPIIMITGVKVEAEDKVLGFISGANDYIVKPFYPEELLARVKAILRYKLSEPQTTQSSLFRVRGLEIDFTRKSARVNGENAHLTAIEYRIISCLAQNANNLVPYSEIIKNVWGEGYCEDTHLLQVNIALLRLKIQDDSEPKYIENRPGLGYIMNTWL